MCFVGDGPSPSGRAATLAYRLRGAPFVLSWTTMSKRLAQALVGSLFGLALALVFVWSGTSTGPAPGSEFPCCRRHSPLPTSSSRVTPAKRCASTTSRPEERWFCSLATRTAPIFAHSLWRRSDGRGELLGENGPRVLGVLITVDPERDTPEELTTYLTRFPPGLIGLTGSQEAFGGSGPRITWSAPNTGSTRSRNPTSWPTRGEASWFTGGVVPMTFAAGTDAEAMAEGLALILRD